MLFFRVFWLLNYVDNYIETLYSVLPYIASWSLPAVFKYYLSGCATRSILFLFQCITSGRSGGGQSAVAYGNHISVLLFLPLLLGIQTAERDPRLVSKGQSRITSQPRRDSVTFYAKVKQRHSRKLLRERPNGLQRNRHQLEFVCVFFGKSCAQPACCCCWVFSFPYTNCLTF